ncbi:hypothetical protein OROGR_008088 [Orobanche gracilis]
MVDGPAHGNRTRTRGAQGQRPGKEHVVPEPEPSTCEKEPFEPYWLLGGEKLPENYRFRPTGSNIITIHLWHKGYFVDEPRFDYAHGVCQSFEGWDVDEINSIEIGKLVKSLGYASFKCLWYRYPALGLFNGRRPFNEDADREIPVGGNQDHTQLVHPDQRVREGAGRGQGRRAVTNASQVDERARKKQKMVQGTQESNA